ncbi:MAG: MFS transporter [Nostocoides sp.]
MATPRATPLTPAIRRGYALGSVATGAFGTVPGLLLLPYLTDRLGVAAGLAGLVVLLPKAWDVILNPIAGRISDRHDSPDGRRRPFLLRAGLALAICFVLLFAGPTTPRGLATTWVVVAFVACATAYAFFQVPYVAMPAEMTDDYDERTRLMTRRVAVLALAILVSGGLSPVIRDGLGERWGYVGVGIFVGALIAIGATGAWWGTRHIPASSTTAVALPSSATWGQQLAVIARSRDFRALLTTFILQALATGSMLAGVDYIARHVLGRPGWSSILFVCFVAPALVVTPGWQHVAARYGKRRGYVAASTFMIAGALLAWPSAHTAPVLALAVAVIGIGYAGCQMLPLAMLPDVAANDAVSTGQNRIGMFTGVWTAGETLGLALGPGLFGGVLALGGYASSTTGTAVQTDSALRAVVLGFTLIPAVLIAMSLWPLARYRLTAADTWDLTEREPT